VVHRRLVSKNQNQNKKMKMKKYVVCVAATALALVALAAPLSAVPLTDQNKQFLANYEKVHQALVADDLATAKKAAADLGSPGSDLAKSETLDQARAAFEKLSAEAAKLAAGQGGYYVMHCPMKNKDWVQTSDKVANPYGGKEMLGCGEVKK
jgi:uncharacterized iron-regulated protein